MRNRRAAFTLMEMLVSTLVASVLGGIVYTVASEALYSFARNASLNRTYTDSRSAVNQIASMIQSAPHAPQPLDANGVPTTGQSAGVRFYCYGGLPTYAIPSGQTTDTTLTIQYTPAQSPNGQVPVAMGDLATIPLLGFQDTITNVSGATSVSGGNKSVTLTFANALYNNCVPALPVDSAKKSIPVNLAYQAASGSNPAVYYTCVVYRQAAFVAVPNTVTGGADLRFYPQAMSTGAGKACGNQSGFNSTTAFSNAKNYSVLATIPANVTDTTLTPFLPFRVSGSNGTVLQVALCSTSPDYSNNKNLRPSNTYSLMRSAMAARSPILLHPMTNPF